jgi:hypothetical protein
MEAMYAALAVDARAASVLAVKHSCNPLAPCGLMAEPSRAAGGGAFVVEKLVVVATRSVVVVVATS